MGGGVMALRYGKIPTSTIYTCRGCGCDDMNACVTDDGPCAWVLLDVETPTGVCSCCAWDVGWHPVELAIMGKGKAA
jgi:hypothetical protein